MQDMRERCTENMDDQKAKSDKGKDELTLVPRKIIWAIARVREFGMEEFGDNAGYVQLYMFHYARMSGLMGRLK